MKLLSLSEIVEIFLWSPSSLRRRLIIAAQLQAHRECIRVVRGDLSFAYLPLTLFKANSTSNPDFSDLEIIDYGQALRFGSYCAFTADLL